MAERAPRTTDEALLLRRYPYGESSLVLHLLTREHGRVHALAKGAYRAKSGYCGVFDFFDTLRVSWGGALGELVPVAGAEVLERRPGLARDLGRYRGALAALELLDLVSPAGQAEPAGFELARRTLDALADGRRPLGWTLAAFDLRLLGTLGLAPALVHCAACGGEAPPIDGAGRRAAFSAGAGGRLCLACAREARASGRRVGTLAVDVLALAQELVERGGPAGAVDAALARELASFVHRFLEYHLETRPRAREALSPPTTATREPGGTSP